VTENGRELSNSLTVSFAKLKKGNDLFVKKLAKMASQQIHSTSSSTTVATQPLGERIKPIATLNEMNDAKSTTAATVTNVNNTTNVAQVVKEIQQMHAVAASSIEKQQYKVTISTF
jgi:hypothetical protein